MRRALGGPPPAPAYSQNFFTGVPAPAGAGLVLFPLFAALVLQDWGWATLAGAVRHPVFVGTLLVVVGGADGLHPADLELQELQGPLANTCCRCCSASAPMSRCC